MLGRKIKILFFMGACGSDKLMLKIGQELEKKGEIEAYYLACMQRNLDLLCAEYISPDRIIKLINDTKNERVNPDMDYLRESEKKYNFRLWDAWSITAPRKKNRAKLRSNIILSWIEFNIKQFEEIIKKIKPDYYFCYAPAGYDTFIYYQVVLGKNIKIMELQSANLSNRFVIADNLQSKLPILNREYKNIKKRDLTTEERIQAETYINEYVNKPIKPDCIKKYDEVLGEKIKRIKSYALMLLKSKQLPDYELTIKPLMVWPMKGIYYNLIKLFEKPVEGEKYVFYPLPFQPEASTLVYGKWYVDQAAIIENIAKALPFDCKLYVKDHVYGYGSKPLNLFKRLKKLPNVRLISVKVNTYDLIKNSSLIITVNSTVGWEALLFQKPVITLGDTFYNSFDEVVKIKNIEELPLIISKKIDTQINYENIVKIVAAMFKSSYTGLARLPADCKDKSLKLENIKKLVEGIEDYINKIENNYFTDPKKEEVKTNSI